MKHLVICLFLVVHSVCVAAVTKLPAEHQKVLEDSSRFLEVHATTNLPAAIVALCADSNGMLAEPGQKWQATDAIPLGKPLPQKRLVWAATAGQYYVVHYESGGRGHSFHILLATIAKGQKPKVVWHAVSHGPLNNYSAFIGALRTGKLDDTLNYAH